MIFSTSVGPYRRIATPCARSMKMRKSTSTASRVRCPRVPCARCLEPTRPVRWPHCRASSRDKRYLPEPLPPHDLGLLGMVIQDEDLIRVDLLSRPFRNSPSGGTSQAAGTAALAFLGRWLSSWVILRPLKSTWVWPPGPSQAMTSHPSILWPQMPLPVPVSSPSLKFPCSRR